MPAGALVTLPFVGGLTVTVKVFNVKVAVTVLALVMETVQVPVPPQPSPLQPVKTELMSGVAERVTLVLKA